MKFFHESLHVRLRTTDVIKAQAPSHQCNTSVSHHRLYKKRPLLRGCRLQTLIHSMIMAGFKQQAANLMCQSGSHVPAWAPSAY